MHEFSIVQNLINILEDKVKDHGGKSVSKVVVKVGKLSGVEPHLLQVAFDFIKQGTVAEKSELVLEVQDILINCKNCGSVDKVEDYNFVCRKCGSSEIEVVDGKDMILKSIEIDG